MNTTFNIFRSLINGDEFPSPNYTLSTDGAEEVLGALQLHYQKDRYGVYGTEVAKQLKNRCEAWLKRKNPDAPPHVRESIQMLVHLSRQAESLENGTIVWGRTDQPGAPARLPFNF